METSSCLHFVAYQGIPLVSFCSVYQLNTFDDQVVVNDNDYSEVLRGAVPCLVGYNQCQSCNGNSASGWKHAMVTPIPKGGNLTCTHTACFNTTKLQKNSDLGFLMILG